MTKERQPLTDDSWSADTALFAIDDAIESICNEFASKLHAGQAVAIEDVLNETNGPDRTMLISRLILIEFRHRWIRGETPSLDDYLSRFPAETETIQGLVPQIEKMARRFSLALMETVVKPEVLKTIGHFQIREVLGRGSFGTVWQAWDTKLRRHVAIKSITHYDDPARDLPMAMHEAHAVASLNHPNIVRIFDVEEIEDRLCLVSEYVEGVNLGKELADGLLDFKKSAFICQRIAEALQHAHDHGVIHRDIKPTNILINANGEPLLTDFGVAKYSHADKTLSDEGKVVGSVRYMSPEQSRCGEIDGRSDVYSLGVVLYELITGRPPFTGSIKEVMFSHQFRDPRSPRAVNPKIPKDLETICLKAMSKNSGDRYQTAGAMGKDLGRCLAGELILAKRRTLVKILASKCRQNPWFFGSALATFSMLGITVLAIANAATSASPHNYGQWNVIVETSPPGATLSIIPIDPLTGKQISTGKFANPKETTPLSLWLPPGTYRVCASHDRYATAEVERLVPQIAEINSRIPDKPTFWFRKEGEKETIGWLEICLPQKNISDSMYYIPSTMEIQQVYHDFMASDGNINSFYVAPQEFRLHDYLKIRDSPPQHHRNDAPGAPFLCSQIRAKHWAEEAGGRLLKLKEIRHVLCYVKFLRQHHKKPLGTQSLDDLISLCDSLTDDISEWTATLDPLSTEKFRAYRVTGAGISYSTFETSLDLVNTGQDTLRTTFRIARSGP